MLIELGSLEIGKKMKHEINIVTIASFFFFFLSEPPVAPVTLGFRVGKLGQVQSS